MGMQLVGNLTSLTKILGRHTLLSVAVVELALLTKRHGTTNVLRTADVDRVDSYLQQLVLPWIFSRH